MRVKDMSFVWRRIVCLIVACLLPFQFVGSYGVARAEMFEEHQLMVGDILTISTQALNRLSITDPDVADISDAKPDAVTLMGKNPGQTILFIWETGGKRSIVIRVVSQDLVMLKARIQSLMESAGISTVQLDENQMEGKLVISGEVPEDKEEAYAKIMDGFSDQVIDLTKAEDSKELVQIDMQITELSTTLNKSMGVLWAPTTINVQESNNPQTGKIADIFKLGDFNRTDSLLAQINLLIEEGKARILSKPRIVVKSGKEATFLVGGEIPIKTTTTGTDGSSTLTENVEYKEYGVSLSVTPTIREGKVNIVLSTEISDVDSSPPSAVTATNTTAFLTRSAQTELFLNDRQTIVLAGLIRKNRSRGESRVPFLGKIPIIGMLFKSTKTTTPDADTEVVISLTPTIISSNKKDASEEKKSSEVKKDLPRSVDPVTADGSGLAVGVTSRDTVGLPPITKNVGTVSANVPEAMAPYVQAIQEKISSAIAFPYEAQQNGWQGTVKLALVLKRDGSLRDVFVKESSGYEVFDQDAVNTAQILAPYPAFPDNIKEDELSLTIPIVYSLDSFLKNVAKRN